MTTQELKQYINNKLGNSIRCLLPSYWWKKLFDLVIDKVDEKADKSYVDKAIKNIDVDIQVDSTLSTTSKNPVENKAITAELNKKQSVLVSGTSIKTINGNSLLGSGNLEIFEAPCILLASDDVAMEFIIYSIECQLGNSGSIPRGFVVYDNVNSSGDPTGFEFCEVDIVNYRFDETTETVYGFYEFCHDGSRYRRTYNFNTGTLEGEEVISSAGDEDEVATVPIVNSEEELLSYNSEEIAAAKILELSGVRDWVEGETVIKHLSFAPTLEPTMSAPSSDISFTVINKEHTAGVAIVVYKGGYIGAQLVVDGGTASRVQLYENGVLITESVQEINNVLAENDCVFYTVTPKSEETYALLDLLVKSSNDKGLVNYVNGEIKYLATKDDVIANEKAIKELQTTVNATVESLADYATVESLAGAVNSINDNIVANEQVTASALNDLNSRINEILTRLTEAGI